MDSKVKLKIIALDVTQEFTFEHAQNILRKDFKFEKFEIADKKKFQFINNELIKRPSPKSSGKSDKSKGNKEGE